MNPNLLFFLTFVASIGLTVGSLLLYRLLRKRNERRSPLLNRQIGHVPGQQLVKRVADDQDNILVGFMVMYFAFPIALLAWAVPRVPPDRIRLDGGAWLFLLLALGIFAWGIRIFTKHWKRRRHAEDGLLAERITGIQLNRLVAQGCLVLHDLPAEGFNIDHIVVSPRGVYVVETKSIRKPKHAKSGTTYHVKFDGESLRFPDFTATKPVQQAERYAQWVATQLRELKISVPVIPALALPGWHINQTTDVWRTSKVKIFTPMGNGSNFMAKDLGHIDIQTRSFIAQALATRYPKIGE